MQRQEASHEPCSADQRRHPPRRAGRTDHVVTLEQTLRTTPHDAWDACTNPERLGRWLEPVEGDLGVGGAYRLTERHPRDHRSLRQARAFRITWTHGDDASTVDVTFVRDGADTTIQLRHTISDNDHWETYGPAATGVGWDGSLLALTLLLSGNPGSGRAGMTAFDNTEAGRAFVADTAAAWQQAHVASGVAPDQARASSERTVAFYTTES